MLGARGSIISVGDIFTTYALHRLGYIFIARSPSLAQGFLKEIFIEFTQFSITNYSVMGQTLPVLLLCIIPHPSETFLWNEFNPEGVKVSASNEEVFPKSNKSHLDLSIEAFIQEGSISSILSCFSSSVFVLMLSCQFFI